jgi:hypothetical protein
LLRIKEFFRGDPDLGALWQLLDALEDGSVRADDCDDRVRVSGESIDDRNIGFAGKRRAVVRGGVGESKIGENCWLAWLEEVYVSELCKKKKNRKW